MHAGAHHLHARHQPVRDHGLIAIGRHHPHGLRAHGAGLGLIHPHCRGRALLAQRRGRQLNGGQTRQAKRRWRDMHRGPQGRRLGGLDAGLDGKSARHRVGTGRHLTYLTLQGLPPRP